MRLPGKAGQQNRVQTVLYSSAANFRKSFEFHGPALLLCITVATPVSPQATITLYEYILTFFHILLTS